MKREYYYYEEIDSTNKRAKELAQNGCSHGTLLVADVQTAGIGRRGRSWSSEKGTGIYMSMVLRPEIKTDAASMLTLIAALAVAKAMQKSIGTQSPLAQIKWPNDIVINGKKICGILTEMTLAGTGIDYIVVGIGINVLNEEFPEEIRQTASSILLETGVRVDREKLIEMFLEYFEAYYERFVEEQDLSSFLTEYENLLVNKENRVRVLDPHGEYEGIAKGITKKGELIVETANETKLVSGGEVSVRGIYGYV